eukprot:scaffold19661_cov49-Phaeocystis_antarctica.AAC.2
MHDERAAPIVPRCHRPQPACLRYARRCDSVRLRLLLHSAPQKTGHCVPSQPSHRGCRSHPLWLHPVSPVLVRLRG